MVWWWVRGWGFEVEVEVEVGVKVGSRSVGGGRRWDGVWEGIRSACWMVVGPVEDVGWVLKSSERWWDRGLGKADYRRVWLFEA